MRRVTQSYQENVGSRFLSLRHPQARGTGIQLFSRPIARIENLHIPRADDMIMFVNRGGLWLEICRSTNG